MACSEAQLAANRANAQKSTGPKDTSQTRFNGVKHGLAAKHTLLPWEHEKDLDAMILAFEKRFKPIDDYERLEIKQCAECFWRLERALRQEANIIEIAARHEVIKSNEDPENLNKANLEAIALLKASFEMEKFRRYEAHLRKAYKEALARVEKMASLRTTNEVDLSDEPVEQPAPPTQKLRVAKIDFPIRKLPLQVAGSRLKATGT